MFFPEFLLSFSSLNIVKLFDNIVEWDNVWVHFCPCFPVILMFWLDKHDTQKTLNPLFQKRSLKFEDEWTHSPNQCCNVCLFVCFFSCFVVLTMLHWNKKHKCVNDYIQNMFREFLDQEIKQPSDNVPLGAYRRAYFEVAVPCICPFMRNIPTNCPNLLSGTTSFY